MFDFFSRFNYSLLLVGKQHCTCSTIVAWPGVLQVLQRWGTARNNYSAGEIFYVQKRIERAPFLFWPARTNMEGAGSGRGTNLYAYWRLRVRIPLCTCVFCCWLLVLWGASCSARKKASCARPHWRKLQVWGLAAGRLFSPIFFDACFAVYNARRLLGSKTWISAT